MSRRAVRQTESLEAVAPADEVPTEIAFDRTLYDRLGIDEDGRGYFVAAAGDHYLIIETDTTGDLQGPTGVAPHRLEGLIDQVEADHGWRELDESWRAQARAETGGESA